MLTLFEPMVLCGILAVAVVIAFAVIKVVFELLYIVCKLLWLVLGIPARLLGNIRRSIP